MKRLPRYVLDRSLRAFSSFFSSSSSLLLLLQFLLSGYVVDACKVLHPILLCCFHACICQKANPVLITRQWRLVSMDLVQTLWRSKT